MVKNLHAIARDIKRCRFDLWIEKIPRRRARQRTPAFLSGEFQGQRSLAGYSPWDCEESDSTGRLHFHFLFSPQTPTEFSLTLTLNRLEFPESTTFIHLLPEGLPTPGIPTCYNKSVHAVIYSHARLSTCTPTQEHRLCNPPFNQPQQLFNL